MKASELRIGNLISWISSGNIEKVMKIDLKYVNEVSEKDLSPIPLTEEWLLKIGFENDLEISHNVYFKKHFYLEYPKDEVGYNFGWFGVLETAIKCKYVHELQNLYFILTGTELEIK